MKAKAILLALCFAALLGAVLFLYSANSRKESELALVRQENVQAQNALAEAEQATKTQTDAENEKLARSEKEHVELLRLRNEVRQLRDENQQLGKQVQKVQADVQRVQGQAQAAQAQAQSAQAQAQAQLAQAQAQALRQGTQSQQLAPEEAFQKRYGLQATPEQAKVNGCINNLRQIDGAKQQWALENRKTATAVPTAQDLSPYFPNKTLPVCPGSGAYTFNTVAAAPVCSIPTHVMPR